MKAQITDTRDGRISLVLDADTLDGIKVACSEMSKCGGRWDDLLAAIVAYEEYKQAQAVVAAYKPAWDERVAAIKSTFNPSA